MDFAPLLDLNATAPPKIWMLKSPQTLRRYSPPPCALTIGNFDGVHRGHQAMLRQVSIAAKERGLHAAVLTFAPHPKVFFARKNQRPDIAPALITGFRDKINQLQQSGIDDIFIQNFSESFANMPAIEFVEDYLLKKLNVKWLLVGKDFHFGAKRQGDLELLRQYALSHDFEVQTLDDILDSEHTRISSTAVRDALETGNFSKATELLGRPYCISGRVVHGKKLGRTLGFPTMNVRLKTNKAAVSGIFIVQVHGLDPVTPLPAIASLGTRPTVDQGGELLLEVHVLNFSESVYGNVIRVEFLEKIRNEETFNNLHDLQTAMNNDLSIATAFFQQHAVSATDRI